VCPPPQKKPWYIFLKNLILPAPHIILDFITLYLGKSTGHEAHNYAFFSGVLLFRDSFLVEEWSTLTLKSLN
jgi:hypothetical protein